MPLQTDKNFLQLALTVYAIKLDYSNFIPMNALTHFSRQSLWQKLVGAVG
jgi:hypothetical protein